MAKTANAVQGFSAMAGNTIRPEDSTKILSLWKVCQDKISKLAQDWKEISGMLKYRSGSKMTPKQKRGVANWDTIANKFVPSARMGAVVNPPKRDDAKFFGQGVARSTTDTLNSPPVNENIVAEGMWTRPLSILWALRSNDIDKILAAYQLELKKAYDSFLTDAVKIAKIPADSVTKIMATIGDVSVKEKFKLIRGKLGLTAKKKSGTVPPSIPSGATPTVQSTSPSLPSHSVGVAPSGAIPPKILPPTQPPLAATTTPPPSPSTNPTSTAKNGGSGGTLETDPSKATAFVGIMNRVVDIMIDTVKSDKDESAPFMGKDEKGDFKKGMPTTWNDPSPTTKAVSEADSPTPNPDAEKFEAAPGKFLYNFHGYYDKARTFNITMEPKTVSSEIDVGGKKKHMEVMWHNEKHLNEIWVKCFDLTSSPDGTTKKSAASENVKMFQFMDHDVNPRTPAGKQFSIEKIFKSAQPSKDPFKMADPAVLQQLMSKSQELLRACYATVYRKAMEFKAKKKKPETPSDSSTISMATSPTPDPKTPKAGVTNDGKFSWDVNGKLLRNPLTAKGKPDPSSKPIEVTPAMELDPAEISSLTTAGYAVMFNDQFKKLTQKALVAPTPKPKAASAAPAAPTAAPSTPPAAEAPKATIPAPAPKAEPSTTPPPSGSTARPKQKITLSAAEAKWPSLKGKLKLKSKVWVGGGKGDADVTPENADKWAYVVADDSPKTP